MTTQQVIDIGTRALIMCAKVSGPFLIVVLAVGVVVGLLQSVTQLQEQALSFVR
jgi:flagellar biosynthetic protein FliQ